MGDTVYLDDQPFDERLIAIGRESQVEARGYLEQLAETAKKISVAISSAEGPDQVDALRELLQKAQDASERAQVEKNLATLSERQLEAIGAWESGEFQTIGCCGTNRSG